MDFIIEAMQNSDGAAVLRIYEEGILTRNATFEMQAPGWETWDANHLEECRFVARGDGEVFGWVALVPVSSRCVYAGVAEVSIYISEKGRGNGIGKALMQKVIEASESAGYWTLQAGVFPENEASVRLHKSCGFRELGIRERIGKMDDEWRDVLILERRSEKVGL